MQIVKTFTFSDVTATDIPIGSINTDCPTSIRISVLLKTSFNTSGVLVKCNFIPSIGNSVSSQFFIQSSTLEGFEYQLMSTLSGNGLGIYAYSNGLLSINLDTLGNPSPTIGECTVVVDINSYPVI